MEEKKDKKGVVIDIAAIVTGVCAGGVIDYILEACMPARVRGIAKLMYKLGALAIGTFAADRIYDATRKEITEICEAIDKADEENEEENKNVETA